MHNNEVRKPLIACKARLLKSDWLFKRFQKAANPSLDIYTKAFKSFARITHTKKCKHLKQVAKSFKTNIAKEPLKK